MSPKPALEEAHDLSAPTGAIVYHAVRKEGEDELSRNTSALAWSGLAAGMSMGFSFAAEGLLRAALPDAPWRPLVAKLGYSVGFLIVVLGRQQLFTENTLTVILPALRRRDSLMAANVMRLWTTVLAANLIGAAVFAWVVARGPVFQADVQNALAALGREAVEPTFGPMLLRGVFAGWLIALMVWLLPFAQTSRVWVIIIITYIVGLGRLSHVIAGSVEALFLVARAELSPGGYVIRYLVPSLVGNIIGGVSLVAAVAHAQFVAGSEAHDV
jgi:formate/nitrite transporter FocA (FNT family)